MTVRIDELINPKQCSECGNSAKWLVTDGNINDYLSFYYCDEDLPLDLALLKVYKEEDKLSLVRLSVLMSVSLSEAMKVSDKAIDRGLISFNH